MVGLNVHDVTVDGRRARLRRTDHELIITPRRKLRKHHRFVAVRYNEGFSTYAEWMWAGAMTLQARRSDHPESAVTRADDGHAAAARSMERGGQGARAWVERRQGLGNVHDH